MQEGTINVQSQNIFPIIKKFLYSDNEIFLREIISNAVDATQKVKTLTGVGEVKAKTENLKVEVKLDKDNKTITVSDNGIGMTGEEVEKYINQIAFSSAEEFVDKYEKASDKKNAIIGHFGLGFYSAFMVAEKVDIVSRSQKPNSQPVHWECDGSPNFKMEETSKKSKGTDVIMHINEECEEFLDENKIQEILDKYCKFLPVPIKFGTKTRTVKEKDENGEEQDKEVTEENIINNTTPAWTKPPAELSEEDYKNFYRELYPSTFEEPLFYIHLNVDYPFNLTGILYFPRLKQNMEMQRNKIQLFSNQVFITDNVESIVPEFLTLLHGVIDSPDIPLNVSRSYLQEDASVRKISSHITKKVADKLKKMFRDDREDFQKKWDDIKVFMDFGMLTDDKFYDRSIDFTLFKDTEGNFYTLTELQDAIGEKQTDKDGKTVVLYAHDAKAQHTFIENAKERDYKVLLMDSPLTSHLVGLLERKNDKMTFARVDSDTLDNLIKKDEEQPSKLSDEEKKKLKPVIEGVVDKEKFQVDFANLRETDQPMIITQSEFMRRMREQQATGGGGMNMMGQMPEMYNLVVNSNHPLVYKMMQESDNKKQEQVARQLTDLAMLSQQMLTGPELSNFVKRSVDLIEV